MLSVVAHVLPAGLLVAAQDHADALLQRHTGFLDGLHGVQRAQGRALVIAGAAAVDLVALAHGSEGIHRPAVTGGHHVQVAQDGNSLLGFTGKGGVQRIALKAAGDEAFRLAIRQGHVVHLADLRAEGSTGSDSRASLVLDGGHLNPAGQAGGKILGIGVNQVVEFLVHVCILH